MRHTFETIGGDAKDQVAVDHIMGHARDDMASAYRERISDERFHAADSGLVAEARSGRTQRRNPWSFDLLITHPQRGQW